MTVVYAEKSAEPGRSGSCRVVAQARQQSFPDSSTKGGGGSWVMTKLAPQESHRPPRRSSKSPSGSATVITIQPLGPSPVRT
jgi:hypothetical protein